ncbi:Fungal Zn(2)-Cys(6) binuclear cluster domain [Ceratobasidium sp. AG-Ba]|nr:Fungal Zn(2)-Cys(6) binuclear cluster domain [Ceratobasidium sp. AG-Ba]
MSDPPASLVSATPAPATASRKGKETRSRVYIACTLCRQRKIKCGGEQPACRNCTRADLECHYDAEPKRRGPDKKPGTRVRTRKDSTGTVLPSKPRIARPQTLASSNEPLLVPSQAGPARNKKRAPRGSALDQRTSFSNEQAPHLPNNFIGALRRISPPTLPQLEQIAPSSASSRPDSPGDPPAVSRGLSPSVRLPQLPPLATQSLLDGSGSTANTYYNAFDRTLASYSGPETPHMDNAFGDSANGIKLENSHGSASAVRSPSSDIQSATSTRPGHPHITPVLTDIPSGSYLDLSVAGAAVNNTGLASGLPIVQPTSPVFTRLQHTNDPHFSPPTDILAGLAYPRPGIAIPALDRGGRSSDFDKRRGHNQGTAHHTTAELGLDGIEAGGLATPGVGDTPTSDGSYEVEPYKGLSDIQTYSYDQPASIPGEPQYLLPDGNTYDDYTSGYVRRDSRHYRSPSGSSYSTQTDVAYAPPSASSYATSVDSYSSQHDGYPSTAPTPTEVTILPPPVDGLGGSWGKGFGSGAELYDGSVGYVSGTYGSLSESAAPSEYDEATLTDSENQSQGESSLTHRRYQNQFTSRMFYKNMSSWVSEPSAAFTRKTWWDSLLEMYAPTKVEAAHQVTSDLKYLFKSSNYWLSFMNVSLFMTNYNHQERRENIQPSLVLAALAYSTFTQSSEIEKGSAGRARAMQLRDLAQSALEASLNSQRLDPTLAQAAWLLALFEVSAHPEHSSTRSRSALMFLDNIIRLLGLTVLDVMDPNVKVFSPDQVPRLSLSPKKSSLDLPRQYPLTAQSNPTRPATCSCHALSIASTTAHAQLTPFWVSSPGWDPNWTEAEIRLEESRRLVWSSLTLAAGFTAHDAAFAKDPTELHLIHASNFALCFPAEVMMRGVPNAVHSPQENVWALYARAMLLWNSCLTLRKKAERMTDTERAEFAVNVWLETNTIEEALNRHTCGYERNTLFQAREYLFNTRMFISWEFRRYIPSPDTEVHQEFHRRKAEEWLRHQAEVAKRLMQGLHTVTGMTSNVLGKRPYFVWWFMAQVSRCLSLWQCDQSLFVALEVARAFLPPIDYLTCLWPCPVQRARYHDIRQRLHNECVKYGLEPPPPPQLVIPTAVLI